MAEEVKKHLVGGMQRLAAGALGVGVSLTTKDPMAGMAAAAAAMTATDYLRAKASGEPKELAVMEEAVALDYCSRLDARIAAIESRLAEADQKLDRQDLLSKEVTFSKFVKGLGDAATVEKREAIVHATAYQFDPRKGSPATRDYWLARVRETSDAEHALVRLLIEHGEVTFFDNAAYATTQANNGESPAATVLPIGKADVVVLETVAQRVAAMGAGQLVYSGAHRKVISGNAAHSGRAYSLTAVGEEFVKFIHGD